MRRLLRIVMNAATLLSALLLATTVTLWVRSYWVADEVSWITGVIVHSINAERGSLLYRVDTMPGWPIYRAPVYQSFHAGPPQPPDPDERLGFSVKHLDGSPIGGKTDLTRVPIYAPVVVSAILPALVVRLRRSWRRRSRLRNGFCPACGYDLRASPDACPGCGGEQRLTPTRSTHPTQTHPIRPTP